MARVFVTPMFTIIGGDGKEYGPVNADQIRVWISSGRANLDTKARSAGSEEWRRLGDYAEFSGGAGAPPVMSATPESGALAAAATAGPELAGLGQRFGGALVDGILMLLCWLPAATAFGNNLAEQIRSGEKPNPAMMMEAMQGMLIKSLPFLLLLAAVQCVMICLRSQSIGKLVAGTRIVRFADNTRAGLLHGFLLRGTIPLVIERIPILGLLFWLVDVCFIFGDGRRCVHDYIAGTKVVKA